MLIRFPFLGSLALALLVLGCSQKENAGNSMETENAVAFRITFQDGKPAAHMQAQIRPLWYVADTLGTTEESQEFRDLVTDTYGQILCDSLPKGYYVLHVSNDSLGSAKEFYIDDSSNAEFLQELILEPEGSLTGRVALPNGARHAWIQIYGLDNLTQTDSLGNFTFEHLPAGAFRIRAISGDSPSVLGEELVLVRPGLLEHIGTLAIPNSENEDLATWRYSSYLPLDSLVSDWMRPLGNPAILEIRLNSSTFPFSQAMDKGQDLRITDQQDRPIPFLCARWDSGANMAVVRIKVDGTSIDSLSKIHMWWGHPGANKADDTLFWSSVSDSLRLAVNSLLVDDFEGATDQTALPEPIPPSFWYFRAFDTSTVVTPDPDSGFLPALQPAAYGRSGVAAHLQYSSSSDWIELGTKLGSASRSLATLDSVVFWVRGDGVYSIAFDKLIGNAGKAWIHDSLDTAWSRVCVRPQDFLPSTDSIGGNIGWDAVKDSITNLVFFASGGADFWVDDIRMYGVNRDDLK